MLKKCRMLVPCPSCQPMSNINIVVEDGVVSYIGYNLPGGSKSGIVIDCNGFIVFPCLYNAHTHVAMTLFRNVFEGYDLRSWLLRVWSIEKKLTGSIVYEASLLGIYELVANGVCGFIDMYFYPDETARAAKEVGVRVALGPVVMGESVDADKAARAVRYFALKYSGNPYVKPIANIHSVYATPIEAIEAVAKVANELGLPIHIHVSETRWEVERTVKLYGLTPVGLLYKLGALNSKTIAVHLNWANSEDVELLGRVKPIAVHCPSSSMKLGSNGLFPMVELKSKGVTIAIGTDGPATNNTLDVIREARMAALLQSYARRTPLNIAAQLLEAVSRGGARVFGLDGSISTGKPADMILVHAKKPWMSLSKPIESLIYSGSGDAVAYTIVSGRIVYSYEEEASYIDKLASIRDKLESWALKAAETYSLDGAPPCSPPEACR